MTKKIKTITAKDDIYWEELTGCEDELICCKGYTYPIYETVGGAVYFLNEDGNEHRWNIDELEDDFIIEYESDDKSLCTFKQNKPVRKISYTPEELTGKELMCHKDVYMNESVHKIDRCFIKGKTYHVAEFNNQELVFRSDELGNEHWWEYVILGEHFHPVGQKRPLENWIQTISPKKFERCVEECTELGEGIFYNEDTNCVYLHYNPMKGYTVNDDSGFPTRINFTHKPEAFKKMLGIIEINKVGRNSIEALNWKRDMSNLPVIADPFTSPIKSDGGSTSYYQLKTVVSKDSIKELLNGNFEISLETGDVIDMLVGGNFDLGNATKALRRIYQASLGKGKEGIDMNYDANKINYFVKDFIRKVELKNEGL